MPKTTLDKSLFTTAYDRYEQAVMSGKRYVVIYGGAMSSKSYSVHQWECLRLFRAKADCLFLRKAGTDLRESCYKLVKENYTHWGMAPQFAFTYSGDNRAAVYNRTGRKFAFRGAGDVSTMKSLAGYSRAILEEADQFEFSDFMEIDRRVRHPTEPVQLILILNPVSEDHWIKSKLIDGEGYAGQVAVVHCTYHDNQYAAQADIDRLEALKDISEYDYRVYCLGEWGIVKPDNPFFEQFNPNKNLTAGLMYDPKYLVYLSFDFNVTNSVTVRQKVDGQLRYLMEYHLTGVDLKELCQRIALIYGGNMLHFTGDASGNARSATSTGNKSAWNLIRGYMSQFGARYCNYGAVPDKNAGLSTSRFVCNALIQHYTLKAGFLIDRKACPILAADVMKMKTDSEGGLDKKDANKKDYGHIGDCLRYDLANFEYTTFKQLGHFHRPN